MRFTLPLWLALGCGTEPAPTQDVAPAVESAAAPQMELPMATYAWDPQAGDPAVSAELGGPGFTGEGWQTRLEQYVVGSPDAVKGGTLVTYMPDWLPTLRSTGPNANIMTNQLISGMMFETLAGRDPVTNDPVPSLATHWQESEDHETFRFRLNPAARWSDGSPVTTADVVASWKLYTDPETISPLAPIYGHFEEPIALSPYIVEVAVKEANWRNFEYFAGLRVLPAEAFEGGGAAYLERYQFSFPKHSGPYTVNNEDIVSGTSITLTRRTDWWAASNPVNRGLYNFDHVKFVVVADNNLALEKFKKGELDIWTPTIGQWVEELPETDAVKRGLIVTRRVFNQEARGLMGVAINMKRPPLDDVRLREALQLLLDRPMMNDKMLYGEYAYLTSFFQGTEFESPGNTVIPYDELGAVELLEAAGWTELSADGIRVKDGTELRFTLTYPAPQLERFLTVYQESCKRAGLALDLQLTNPGAHFKALSAKEYTLALFTLTGSEVPAPESGWRSALADTPDNGNYTGFADPRADALIEQYNESFDPSVRKRALQELDGLLYAAHPVVLFWYPPSYRMAYWNRFGQPEWGSGRQASGVNMTPAWWVDPDSDARLAAARADAALSMETPPTDLTFWRDYEMPEG